MRSLLQGRSFQALDLLLGAVDSLSANRDIAEALAPETLTSFAQHHVKELFKEVGCVREPRDEDVSEWLLKGDRHALTLALERSGVSDAEKGNSGVAKLCVPDFSNLTFVAALRKGNWHVPALAKRAHPGEVDLSRWSTRELTVVLLQVAHLHGTMPDWPCAYRKSVQGGLRFARLDLPRAGPGAVATLRSLNCPRVWVLACG